MSDPNNIKILIVDDREENIYSLQELIADNSYPVEFLSATSGADALKIAYKEELALILLDVQMPEMDGYEVATILKQTKSTKNIPIIFVTALNQEAKYVVEGYQKGAIDYLFKPLNATITKSKVNSFINIHFQQKKLASDYKDLEMIVEKRTADLKKRNKELEQEMLKRKEVENELNCSNKKLLIKNRDLDLFVNMASHDLKLPMANMEGLLTLLKDDLKSGQANPEPLIDMLDQSVVLMLDTINGLIEKIRSSQKAEETFEIIDCRKTVEEIKMSIYRMIQDTATTIHEEYNASNFLFNKSAFKSILYNLITNSIKYRHAHRAPEINISFNNEGDHFTLIVRDNGKGIPGSQKDRLFKIFERINPEENIEGTGQGLYNLKKMLDNYNASIAVNSVEGEGSEFIINIDASKICSF